MIIKAYRDKNIPCLIDQMPIQRDWMDETWDRHAYHCFPMSLANGLGWSVSFDEDISFIWDGIKDSIGHMEVLSGGDYVSTRRGNATISLETGVVFSPEENISLITMAPPNIFIDGVQTITTIISTSVLQNSLPIALMVTRPNKEIFIPAKTPVASVLPISLSEINSTSLLIKNNYPDYMQKREWLDFMSSRAEISSLKSSTGEWTNFYRDAIDHRGDAFGKHEVKKIRMKVEYE